MSYLSHVILTITLHFSAENITIRLFSDSIELVILAKWIFDPELLLVLPVIVKVAFVLLRIPMFSAEYIVAFTRETEQAYFLFACPA